MPDRLFDDFSGVSREAWMEKILKDLKGKPLDSLRWTSEEGLELFPVFQKGDLPDPSWLHANYPGLTPYLRGSSPIHDAEHPWEMRHDFRAEKVEDAIAVIKETAGPMDGIGLVLGLPYREYLFDWKEIDLPLDRPRDGLLIENDEDMRQLLAGIDWSGKKLHLRAGHAALPLYNYLIHHWKSATGLELEALQGTLDTDPFNRLGADPTVEKLLDLNLDDAAAILFDLEAKGIKNFKALRISLEPHHFMGANAVQQIACALAMAVDYIDLFGERYGFTPAQIIQHLHFQFPIDTDFFTEIAKVRAFRLLMHRVLASYDGVDASSMPPVHGHGSVRSISHLDAHVNILRGTTEAMSAIFGGCDMVSLPAYDQLTQSSTAQSVRIARNVQLILKEESFMGQVMDPAGGSYYTEHLTAAFAAKAWKQFQKIEAGGGYLATWQAGDLLRDLRDQRRTTDQAIAKGKQSILGVNYFANLKDTPPLTIKTGYTRGYELPAKDFFEVPVASRAAAMQEDLPSMGPLSACLEARWQRLGEKKGKAGVLTRLAEPIEQLRGQTQQYIEDGLEVPKAVLLTFGSFKMSQVRASFASNFLAIGGIRSIQHPVSNPIQESLEQLQKEPPMVVVFCSADPDYLTVETKAMMAQARTASPDSVFLLAGKPEGWEELWDGGYIDDCIYTGIDKVQFLSELHLKTEIKQEEPQYEA